MQDAHKVRNRHVAFLASFQNPGTIFAQLSIIYQLPRMFVGSFTLVLPYFPTGTAERVRLLISLAESRMSICLNQHVFPALLAHHRHSLPSSEHSAILLYV